MKTSEHNSIRLSGGSCCVTHDSADAFRVVSGEVLVYIVPWVNETMGRRSLLCQLSAGTLIPAFSFQDMDYHSWRFCLAAMETATLERLPELCTRPLQARFLRENGVEGYEQDGYGNALVNRYRMNLVREDGYLLRTRREKQETQRKTDRLIASVFQKTKRAEKQQGDGALYQVTAELCRCGKIDIAPYERVKACCRQEMTLPDIARVSHFPCREVVLEENWHRADAGLLLVFWGEGRQPAACIPRGRGGYMLSRSGEKPVRLTRQLAEQCQPKAYTIYRPFPQTSMSGKDFARFCIRGLPASDFLAVLLLTIVASLIGLLLPTLNQKLYDQYIPMGDMGVILQIGGLIGAFMLGNIAFSIVKNVGAFRLDSHIRYQVQSAVYQRVFELPEHFFRNYESADLARRIMEAGTLASQVSSLVLSLGLSLVSALFYLYKMFTYSVRLSLFSLLMALIVTAISFFIARGQLKDQAKLIALDGKSDSVMYQFLLGIEKIRIAGIEDRAVYEYMKSFVEQQRTEARMARHTNIGNAITMVSGSLFSLVLYMIAYQTADISVGQFVAFNSAFGMVNSAISGVAQGLLSYLMLEPAYDRVKPVLQTAPEANVSKQIPGEVTGKIDIDHIFFAYGENQTPVFTDLDLHFSPGEYVGIVGASGCGKSTLLRLLLGFERPSAGRIYYDNQDMDDLDLQQLRKHFGVVLQDGDLIAGSIFDNIALTAPRATNQEVEAAVASVGLIDDIRKMPMGLQTMVSENCNTISGGQKQRILIARAIINRPRIIFFDEATSALDNLTQAAVCRTLEQMGATRIVIAHRLSTIQSCDRILVFDRGRVAEEGNYAALMERRGLFYQLASRQLLENI